MKRVIGMAIHRTVAEVVFWEDGRLRQHGRIDLTRSGLEGFGRSLTKADEVMVEATGNAMALGVRARPLCGARDRRQSSSAAALDPSAKRPATLGAGGEQVKAIAHARIKTDTIAAGVLASLRAADFLPEVWVPAAGTERLRRLVARRNQVVRPRTRVKNQGHGILAAHLAPPCPHADPFNGPGRAWLAKQALPDDARAAIVRHLRELDRLAEAPAGLDRDIGATVVDHPDVKRLLTIAGVKVIVAAGLVAAIGDIHRFPSPPEAGELVVVAMEVVHPVRSWKVVAATLATPARSRRMDVHQNAKTTPHGRRLMIERLAEGWSVARLAAAAGVTAKTVGKWRDRHALEGEVGLLDRSSRPHRSPTRLPDSAVAEIIQLRRQRLSGPAIARRLGRPVSTVGLVLRRHRLARLRLLDPKPEIIRYQRDRPGELIHLDIKKLGRIDGVGHRITGERRGQKRGTGWEFLHVCVDDASRLAYTEILPDERKESAVAFLERAIAWLASLGVTVERVMTDNGSAYRSRAFAQACQAAGLKHKRTRPYTPRTNGKAERFVQTSLREWAYLQAFSSSAARTEAMRPWLHGYNRLRPHSALGGKPPFTRLAKDNLLGNDI